MMAYNQNTDRVIAGCAKENGLRELVHKAASYAVFNNGELLWIGGDATDGAVNLRSEPVPKAKALLVVLCDCGV